MAKKININDIKNLGHDEIVNSWYKYIKYKHSKNTTAKKA